jgi:hypothetical protein
LLLSAEDIIISGGRRFVTSENTEFVRNKVIFPPIVTKSCHFSPLNSDRYIKPTSLDMSYRRARGGPAALGGVGMQKSHVGHGGPSFDRESFRREAGSILFEGTREMLLNIKDKEGLIASYDRMDCALAELVDRWSPPADLVKELHAKLEDRVNFIGRKMKTEPSSFWKTEGRKVSLVILKAGGFTSRDLRLDRLVEDAVELLAEKTNLTAEGARRLIHVFATAECKSVSDILANMDESPNHMELLKFLREEGTPKARAEAQRAFERMVPSERKQLAVVIDFPRQNRQPPMRLK